MLTTLAGNLVAIKSRVGTTEGMLPTAEMALEMFFKCPGLMRYTRCPESLHGTLILAMFFRLKILRFEYVRRGKKKNAPQYFQQAHHSRPLDLVFVVAAARKPRR